MKARADGEHIGARLLINSFPIIAYFFLLFQVPPY
jgi:hypothetical protein